MWKTNELGTASLQAGDSTWCLDARGGKFGIALSGADVTKLPSFSLASAEHDRLPTADEHYVRGDQWNINYPQGDGSFALRLTFSSISASENRLVLEVCVSVQTDLLDTHPKIDISLRCDEVVTLDAKEHDGAGHMSLEGSPPISLAKSQHESVAVLLGPHDAPFTSNRSSASMLQLRLFGEFLEKGVIRRARPWIVIDRRKDDFDEAELTSLYRQLCDSPLPLT